MSKVSFVGAPADGILGDEQLTKLAEVFGWHVGAVTGGKGGDDAARDLAVERGLLRESWTGDGRSLEELPMGTGRLCSASD